MSAEQSVLNQNAEPDWKNYDDFARGIDTQPAAGHLRIGAAKRCRSLLKAAGNHVAFQRRSAAGAVGLGGRAARTLTKR